MKSKANVSDDDLIYEMAVTNGCRPQWRDGILGLGWHCTCRNEIHCCDQQCSAITLESAQCKSLSIAE